MHEVGLAAEILDKAVESAQAALGPQARVESLRVRVGDFAGVDAEALRFALEVLAQGGPAANCRVDVLRAPLEITCRCGHKEGEAAMRGACPECGAEAWTVTGGRDLVLEGLEAVAPDEDDDEGADKPKSSRG